MSEAIGAPWEVECLWLVGRSEEPMRMRGGVDQAYRGTCTCRRERETREHTVEGWRRTWAYGLSRGGATAGAGAHATCPAACMHVRRGPAQPMSDF